MRKRFERSAERSAERSSSGLVVGAVVALALIAGAGFLVFQSRKAEYRATSSETPAPESPKAPSGKPVEREPEVKTPARVVEKPLEPARPVEREAKAPPSKFPLPKSGTPIGRNPFDVNDEAAIAAQAKKDMKRKLGPLLQSDALSDAEVQKMLDDEKRDVRKAWALFTRVVHYCQRKGISAETCIGVIARFMELDEPSTGVLPLDSEEGLANWIEAFAAADGASLDRQIDRLK